MKIIREKIKKLFSNTELVTVVVIAAAAVLVRLACLIPSGGDAAVFMRTDSSTYINPALAILSDGAFDTAPGSGVPALKRTPGYPLYLAFLFALSGGGPGFFCVVFSAILGGLTTASVFYAARQILGLKASAFAAMLFALNPTAIAISPMFLADNLFSFIAAFQLLFFMMFVKRHSTWMLTASVLAAAMNVFVRPINLLWIFPCVFVVCFVHGIPWKRKAALAVSMLAIFAAALFPWFLRNKLNGGGWRIDAVSAGTALHNRSALESRLLNRPGSELREEYTAEGERVFAAEPEKYREYSARLDYYEQTFIESVKKHPFRYFMLHFRPVALAPDAATFLENMKMTQTGRGAWDVINRRGLIAGVRHYFGGDYTPLLLLTPFLAVAGIMYLLAFCGLLLSIAKRDMMTILLFLLSSEYYLFMPGPVAMPRYQLCALPFICILAGLALESEIIAKTWRRLFSSKSRC